MDKLAKIVELLALPLTVFFLLVFFFLFVVRPFFAFLFDGKRMDALADLREAQKKLEGRNDNSENNGDQGFSAEERLAQDGIRTDQQKISKIAESDPQKAGELIKQWLKKDQQ
ncbi:MAG: hypothetical protein V1706_12685 [Pseudomonadota bacterium]